jgi:hypothetical protein
MEPAWLIGRLPNFETVEFLRGGTEMLALQESLQIIRNQGIVIGFPEVYSVRSCIEQIPEEEQSAT